MIDSAYEFKPTRFNFQKSKKFIWTCFTLLTVFYIFIFPVNSQNQSVVTLDEDSREGHDSLDAIHRRMRPKSEVDIQFALRDQVTFEPDILGFQI
jgi:hypothetical protein